MATMRLILLVLAPTLAVAGPRGLPKKPRPAASPEKKPAAEPADAPDAAESAPPTAEGDAADADKTGESATRPEAQGSAASAAPGTSTSPGPAKSGAKTDSHATEVDSLRQEYLSLRDELFRSRARASTISAQLYSSRVEIRFTWASGRYYGVSKASVRLDGATVYEDATGAIGGNDGVRFSGYVAPGRHIVTFHVEATGKDDDTFATASDAQIVVKAVANKDLIVAAKAHDAGDIAYQWKRSERGSYNLGIDVAVKTAASATAGASAKAQK